MRVTLRHHRAPGDLAGSRFERGAALVEMAIVGLFIVTLAAATYDLGQGWRAGLAVNEAARTGARTASAMGTQPLADYYALSGARAALGNSNMLDYVERVVIYRSATASGDVPAACKTGTSTSAPCNILTGAQFRALTEAQFNTTTGCFTPATVRNWCPSSRNNIQATAQYWGMWIHLRQPKEFRFLGTHNTVTRDAVMRLEPTES
jgi:Flp pilus assembly protein TadG